MINDLRKKSECHRKDATNQEGLTTSNGLFRSGDIIDFWAGYNNDIRYRAEIAGFIGDDIYLIWDCFWSPIRNDNQRKIVRC